MNPYSPLKENLDDNKEHHNILRRRNAHRSSTHARKRNVLEGHTSSPDHPRKRLWSGILLRGGIIHRHEPYRCRGHRNLDIDSAVCSPTSPFVSEMRLTSLPFGGIVRDDSLIAISRRDTLIRKKGGAGNGISRAGL